jgi:hypothetical protein
MKKITFVVFISILGILSGYTQGHTQGVASPKSPEQNLQTNQSVSVEQTQQKYSKLNLQEASLQDLNYQLNKAKILKQTGIVLSIVGPAAAIGGLAALNMFLSESDGTLFVAGFLTTVAAIPIVITGSTRVRAIENEMVTRNRDSIVNIQLYNKAKVMRGAGLFLTVAGPIALATAVFLDINNNSAANPIYIAGAISTGVGIPLLIVGSKRVNKIVGGLTTHDAASLNIAPGFVYNNKTQNLYPGVTLRVRF